MEKGYFVEALTPSIRKFYGRHRNPVDRCGVSIYKIGNYNVRNNQFINILNPINRQSIYQHPFFLPSCIPLWNSIDIDIRKGHLFSIFDFKESWKAPHKYFYYHVRSLRLQNKCGIF